MNNYLKYKAKKLINETLEKKANEVMEKIKFNKPGSSFDYVEEEICECGSQMVEGMCSECGYRSGEVMEKLYGNQKRIDKNHNGRIDREDFKMLRRRKETKEIKSECMECGSPMDEGMCSECGYRGGEVMEKLYGNQKRIDKNHNGRIDREDFKMLRRRKETKERKGECVECGNGSSNVNENVFYELTMGLNGRKEKLLFTESQFENVIEDIVLKEEKKFNKGKTPAGYAEYERSIKKSKKEEGDYMKDLNKKMKDYLKDGSKAEYSESPKHFPKGNGELEKMTKKAYVPSGSVQDYIDNFTAAGLENLDYDEIHPNEDWVKDNIIGSSKTGNNPEWANAVETPNNKKRNEIREKNMLAKIKRKAYNKSPQPVVKDEAGESEGDKIMAKLESIDEKKKQKINEEFSRIMDIMTYNKNTQ